MVANYSAANICEFTSALTVFGPAFIKAYDLESKQAGHARIILCNMMWKKTKEWFESGHDLSSYLRNMVIRDADGPAKVDLFAHYKIDISSGVDISNELKDVKYRMEDVLSFYVESPRVFSKLARFAKEFNNLLLDIEKPEFKIQDYHLNSL